MRAPITVLRTTVCRGSIRPGLVTGMSRVFSLPRYVGVMALATTPLPIMLWIGRPG